MLSISSRKTFKAPPHLCPISAFRSPRVLYAGAFFIPYWEDVYGFLPELHMEKRHFCGNSLTRSSPDPIEGALRQFTKSCTPTWPIDMQSEFSNIDQGTLWHQKNIGSTTGNCLERCLKWSHERIHCTMNANCTLRVVAVAILESSLPT